MNLIENMLSSGGGAGIGQALASQFGISGDQVGSILQNVAPVFAHGLKDKLGVEGGTGGLTDLLTSGSFSKYADDPAAATSPAAAQDGQNVLGSLFGGAGSSSLTNLISSVAGKSGVGSGAIQSILPVIASLFMGFLSKQAASGGIGQVTETLGTLSGDHAGIFGALKTAAGKIFN